ncbi:hypothetical protein ACFPU1_06980 [Thalassorhabdus alkalitolerans]|uniref:Uncharacterized protein n=1 Tax=Thalassorhabdus alkalitolerans TaxID=2282697 RepID=A0ABW0YM77_9BACI
MAIRHLLLGTFIFCAVALFSFLLLFQGLGLNETISVLAALLLAFAAEWVYRKNTQ